MVDTGHRNLSENKMYLHADERQLLITQTEHPPIEYFITVRTYRNGTVATLMFNSKQHINAAVYLAYFHYSTCRQMNPSSCITFSVPTHFLLSIYVTLAAADTQMSYSPEKNAFLFSSGNRGKELWSKQSSDAFECRSIL